MSLEIDILRDTEPEIEAMYRQMLMARSPEERVRMSAQMGESVRAVVLASLPATLTPVERKIALLRRYYASDFSEAELEKVEASIRAADVTNPAAAARDFPGSL